MRPTVWVRSEPALRMRHWSASSQRSWHWRAHSTSVPHHKFAAYLRAHSAPRYVLVVTGSAASGLLLGLAMHPPGHESRHRISDSAHCCHRLMARESALSRPGCPGNGFADVHFQQLASGGERPAGRGADGGGGTWWVAVADRPDIQPPGRV